MKMAMIGKMRVLNEYGVLNVFFPRCKSVSSITTLKL